MQFSAFKQMMRKAKVGQHICYHIGEMSVDRVHDCDLDLIAKFCFTLYTINAARIYQKREDGVMHYVVVLLDRLKVRKDQQGSFQEAVGLTEYDNG